MTETRYTRVVVAVVPDAQRESINTLMRAVDYDLSEDGPGTFAIPLAATTDGPPTHWGVNTVCQPETEALWGDCINGVLPNGLDLSPYGLTDQAAIEAVQAATVRLSARTLPDTNAAFDALLADHDPPLVLVVPDDPL